MGEIITLDALVKCVAEYRAAGETVGLANGCFDVLHVGHVRYLLGAAREADRLVVAVNDDVSVGRLKGAGRPILTVVDRVEIVSALRVVDKVLEFSGDTVADVIRAIKPDVHCKGSDYTVESVPEVDLVASYGGRTAIVGDPKDHSTRELLARIVRDVGSP